ncbi:hypothetical protein Q8A73_001704 [Channa argus]|nr:hypothetical protein Q8A73_001704 [Channa argus]
MGDGAVRKRLLTWPWPWKVLPCRCLLTYSQRIVRTITAALQRRFGQRTSVEQSREQLAGRYRHDGESLGAFAADVQLYTQRGYPTFPVAAREELSLHSFLRGLAPERLCQHVRLSTPRSLEEALIEAERAEEVLGAVSAPWEPHSQGQRTPTAKPPLAQRSGGNLDAAQRQQLNRLLQDFVDIFAAKDEDCTRTGLVQHHIDTGDAPPIRLRPHRLPAFQRLKVALSEAPVLAYPDPQQPFIVDTDASGVGIGAVLSQGGETGERVVAYYSCSLSRPERNYCVIRRDLLAVVLAVRHFRPYLLGTRFTLRTDHASLTWLLNFKQPEGQVARWLEILQEYDFDIQHRPGRQHGNADALYRRPCLLDECRYCRRHEERELGPSAATVTTGEGEPFSQGQRTPAPAGQERQWRRRGSRTARASAPQPPHRDHRSPAQAGQERQRRRRGSRSTKASAPQPPHRDHRSPAQAGQEGQRRHRGSRTGPAYPNSQPPRAYAPPSDESRSAENSCSSIRRWIRCWLETQQRPEWLAISARGPEIKLLHSQWDSLELCDGILYRRWRAPGGGADRLQLLVPSALRAEVLRWVCGSAGAGHFGNSKTVRHLQQRFCWPGCRQDAELHVHCCDDCTAQKGPTQRSRGPLQQYLVGAPMERVGVDILGPFPTTEAGNRYILVGMDYFTKWPEPYAVPDMTATTAAQRLVEDMFSRFGVPEELHSDQGRNFESRLFAKVCQRLGVRKTRTTPLHPQSDGLVEQFNCTLATQLGILTSRHQKDWDQHLPLVLWAYRTAVQESSQCTPATLMFGRELRTPVDLVFGPPPEPEITGGPELDYLRRLKERLSVVHQLARESQGDAGARQKRAYDGRCHGHPFSVGDNVLVYCPVRKRGLSPKLTSHWQGPGEILDRISEVVYRVRMPGRGRRVVLHRDRLAPSNPLAPNPVTEPEDSLLSATTSASMNNGGLGAEPGMVSGPLQRPARARRLPGQLRDFVVGLSD